MDIQLTQSCKTLIKQSAIALLLFTAVYFFCNGESPDHILRAAGQGRDVHIIDGVLILLWVWFFSYSLGIFSTSRSETYDRFYNKAPYRLLFPVVFLKYLLIVLTAFFLFYFPVFMTAYAQHNLVIYIFSHLNPEQDINIVLSIITMEIIAQTTAIAFTAVDHWRYKVKGETLFLAFGYHALAISIGLIVCYIPYVLSYYDVIDKHEGWVFFIWFIVPVFHLIATSISGRQLLEETPDLTHFPLFGKVIDSICNRLTAILPGHNCRTLKNRPLINKVLCHFSKIKDEEEDH